MGEKLKALWNRRKYIIILGSLVVAGAAWIIWLLYDFVYSSNHAEIPLEQRTAFVSMWVAIVGFSLAVAGTVIAVLQFQASRRKPDLHLWIGQVGKDRVTLVQRGQHIKLVLGNRGNGVARYVECKIWFFLPRYEDTPGLTRVRIDQDASGYWHRWTRQSRRSTNGLDYSIVTFVGGNKYVIYDQDSVTIGALFVRREGLAEPRYKVKYQLRCEGMPRKTGLLWLEVPEEARS
jgi:hypothetical protein